MFGLYKELFSFRGMIYNLVKRDLRTRYKGSILGFLWTFVNPLLMLVVYTIVFSTFMRVNVENYAMFLFVALMPWLFFANTVLTSSGVIVNNGNLVKKVYFPREVLPLALTLGGLVNFLLTFIIILLALVVFGIKLNGITILINIPLIICVEFIITYGFSLIVSSVNVYFRDLEHILGIVMMAWVYLTPVLYPLDMIPEKYLFIYQLNPLSPIILAYRDVLFYGISPNYHELFKVFLLGCGIYILGRVIFAHLKKEFAEEI